jgi:hypothetical protein
VIWLQHPPPPGVIKYTPTHHHSLIPQPLPTPSIAPYHRLPRHTRNRAPAARFRVFGPKHPLPACVIRRPPQPPPWPRPRPPPNLPIAPYRRLPWHTRNRAPASRFRAFGPKHPFPACVVRRPPQPPPWPHPPAPTNLTYRPLPPSPPAHPKPSPGGSISGFWPQTPPPRLRRQTAAQTTITPSPPGPYDCP